MSKHRQSRFKLVEVDGWSEDEIYEAQTLEELQEFLNQKGGNR